MMTVLFLVGVNIVCFTDCDNLLHMFASVFIFSVFVLLCCTSLGLYVSGECQNAISFSGNSTLKITILLAFYIFVTWKSRKPVKSVFSPNCLKGG